ncbi:MAG: hypothetical protein ABIP51_00915 [Bacteroidia bacterium]
MTIEEAKDLIIKNYDRYFNKKVYFASTGDVLVIKAIDVTKKETGEYDATCYTEKAYEEDANFENGIFEHRSLNDVIRDGCVIDV